MTPGDILGPYRIERLIGAGGMGEVYRAHDSRLERDVAIKVLTGYASSDPDARRRLLREARAAAALNHPHVCTIHEVGETGGQAYIAMELIDGQSVDQLLPPGGFPLDRALRYGLEIAEAVAHAHDRGIVHRDLKTANTVITPQGHTKVLDFGLATRHTGAGLADGKTQTQTLTTAAGAVAGTLEYMAPEQMRGEQADARSDVWALGVLLYELIAGVRPFRKESMLALTAAILSDPPAPLPDTVPPDVKRVIERCLAKSPHERYQRAGELVVALQAVRPDTSISRARFGKRTMLIAAGAALVVAAAIGLLGVERVRQWLRRGAEGAPTAIVQRGSNAPAQLAVMPLRVITEPGAGDSAYLGVGIADAITTRLANVRQIVLRPTSAVLRYKDAELDSSGVATALGVQHLLLGTIQHAEETYRVTVQLVRADGVAIWGRTYDLPRAGLLRLQDDVAGQVVTALRVELSAPERARLTARPTEDPAAYDRYLRGRTLLLNYTEANMRDAIERFEQSLTLDPGYARARAALAMACAWFSVRYAYGSNATVWGKRAEAEARAALDQDASLGDAHLALASAAGTLYRDFEWKTVLSESATALALDPSLELAHVTRMRAFYHLGLFDQARDEGRRARALNPSPPVEMTRLEVAIDLFDGNFAAAADRAADLLQRTDAPVVRHYLGLARFYLGNPAEARDMLASAVLGGQPDVRAQASLASIEAVGGLRTEARARALAIERGPYMDHHVAYSLGAAWAQLGDPTAGIRWLKQAADTGFPCYPWFARDPLLEPLRRESAYKELMARLEAQRAALR